MVVHMFARGALAGCAILLIVGVAFLIVRILTIVVCKVLGIKLEKPPIPDDKSTVSLFIEDID
jgi:hypothetical protein